MKLLIQLTFNNGLGNLYCGAIEVLNFANYYKSLGYDCELIFASNGNAGSNKFIDYVDFEEIFDLESFSIFDKITNLKHSTSDKDYNGYKYHSTQYGPNYPGAHWWDVFFDEIPEELYPKYPFNMETLLRNEHVPKWIPKLNKNIYNKVNEFLEKNGTIDKAIQIRYNDYTLNPPEDFKIYCGNLSEKLKNLGGKFYVTSHNQYAMDSLSKLNNVVIYEYKNLKELPNDHCYYFYNKNFDRDVLLERLYDNLAEMVLLSNCSNIYFYFSSAFSWTTTFLYYSKSNNSSQQLININNDLNLIK
jgi:hypothetical protein